MDNVTLDIILFAVIAAFFVFRLRSVLGRRTGHERPPRERYEGPAAEAGAEESGNVVQMPDRSRGADEDIGADTDDDAFDTDSLTPLEAGLRAITRADQNFEPESFTDGSKMAFEMVVNSFANGDRDTLRPLLNDQVYKDFSAAITAREKAGETLETTFVGIRQAEILAAELKEKMAFITMKFVSDQINVTRDADGKAIEGDTSHVDEITDIWQFARNTRSRDPNWLLVATQSPQ